jgi:hypothetical protein
MIAKQTAPLITALPAIVTAAPPLIIGGAICVGGFYFLKWLFSDDEKKQPEAVPANTAAENQRKLAESAVLRSIPAEIPAAKPATMPVVSASRPVVSPPAVPPVPKVSLPVPAPVVASVPSAPRVQAPLPAPPPPIKRKVVTREDVANVFQRAGRGLSRTAAVAALK